MAAWVGPAIMAAASLIGSREQSKAAKAASKQTTTTTTNNAPWSGLQPYLTGTDPLPPYLTQAPEVTADWKARMEALGAGALPTNTQNAQGIATAQTPSMIDEEATNAKYAEYAKQQELAAKRRAIEEAIRARALRTQGLTEDDYNQIQQRFGLSEYENQLDPAGRNPGLRQNSKNWESSSKNKAQPKDPLESLLKQYLEMQ